MDLNILIGYYQKEETNRIDSKNKVFFKRKGPITRPYPSDILVNA